MLPPMKKRASADAGLPCSNVAALPLVVLDHDEVIAERLTAAVGDESPDQFMIELLKAVKASGVAQVAEASGLRRESLYRALAPGAHPRFETIRAVLRALNVDFRIIKKASVVVPFPARRMAKKLKKDATKKLARRRKAARV
jgi:probable addiction module antidote protein